jgi:hypothetical protein
MDTDRARQLELLLLLRPDFDPRGRSDDYVEGWHDAEVSAFDRSRARHDTCSPAHAPWQLPTISNPRPD